MKLLALALLSGLFPLSAQMPEPKIIRPDKSQKEVTQTLEAAPEVPLTVSAETRKLAFAVTPLSNKGLLSEQIRTALRWLFRSGRGGHIVKLRAFVAGSGDLRRVPALVGELFGERKLPLPAVSVIQAGALPLEGAQVLFEAVIQEKKEVNPNGLAFFSAQSATGEQPLEDVGPLGEKALASLGSQLAAAGVKPASVLRAACFVSSLAGAEAVRRRLVEAFPATPALAIVQTQRASPVSVSACEATARLDTRQAAPVSFPGAGGQRPNGFSPAAAVGAKRVVLSGTQLAFGFEPGDARLAFERIEKAVSKAGGRSLAFVSVYPISNSVAGLVRKVEPEFFDRANPPAGTALPFEALTSVDAAFAVDAIAVIPDSKEP